MKKKTTQNQRLRFVLVQPRNPMNIGAAARAMANFGFRDMRVVDPYEPVWKETRSAVGAESVVKKAKKVATLTAAVRDCHWVIGTSAGQRRSQDHRWITPVQLHDLLDSGSPRSRVALVFGSEKNGLSNEHLDQCHRILHLPTDPACVSMNLSHAVAVVAYLLNPFEKKGMSSRVPPWPEAKALERLVEHALSVCEISGLFSRWTVAKRQQRLRQAVYQWNVRNRDVAFLHEIFRLIAKQARMKG